MSRLSPAIRHRLVTEDEVAAAVLEVYPLARVEKFIQEIYWRRYWKSWLSLRPEVWTEFRTTLAELMRGGGGAVIARAEQGQMGNAVIDHFTRELVETGYLHNHARMWYAAWWVHEARLPWELGAELFYKYLLDGDPASNTLSWRWVAGIQTPGKTYLARRENLEKYLAPELLESLRGGLPGFENPAPLVAAGMAGTAVSRPELSQSPEVDPARPVGLWIHEDDLSPESSPAGAMEFQSILVTGDRTGWGEMNFQKPKCDWLASATGDAVERAGAHWKTEPILSITSSLAEELIRWARSNQLSQVVTIRPEVGLLGSGIISLSEILAVEGIRLVLIDRPRDLALRPLAIGGFFKFWEKMQKDRLWQI